MAVRCSQKACRLCVEEPALSGFITPLSKPGWYKMLHDISCYDASRLFVQERHRMKTISWVSSSGRVRVLPHRNFSLAVSLHLLPITTNVHSPSSQKWCKIVTVFIGLCYNPTDFFFPKLSINFIDFKTQRYFPNILIQFVISHNILCREHLQVSQVC